MTARKSPAKKAAAKKAAAPKTSVATPPTDESSVAAATDLAPASELTDETGRPVWEAGELRQDYVRRLHAWEGR